jgi:uncharacterized protein involved in exopolysaccharide biosynthesis
MMACNNIEAMSSASDVDSELTLLELLRVVGSRWRALLATAIGAGGLAFGATFLIAPTFTATTVFMPPQQAQSSAVNALASLGALGGLAAGAAGARSPAEQYVALMQSATVSDRLVDSFGLMSVYEAKLRVDARRELADRVRVSVGKRDGLITVEVDDTDPKRAADIANRYVDELRRMTGLLAVTEAQQRRLFFEEQLKQSRTRLDSAQQALQSSGFSAGALKAEPKSAAESYAKLKAELTSTEVRLQTLRSSLTESAPEVRQLRVLASALREQLARAGDGSQASGGADYVGRYREFKYQETLFELFARQYEQARVDESREGALVQVVDPAKAPERKSRPKRAMVAASASLLAAALLIALTIGRHVMRREPRG